MKAKETFQDKINNFDKYKDEALDWLNENYSKVKELFDETPVSHFIFEPFMGVFENKSKLIEDDIYSLITKVAIINMVLAGLPGRMGVGVFVSIALEIWMAFRIAQFVGLKEIKSFNDVIRYIGIIASAGLLVFEGFKVLIGFFIGIVSSFVPFSPIIAAELLATNLLGIIFMFGFKNILHAKDFKNINYYEVISQTRSLTLHQWTFVKNTLNLENLKTVGVRLKEFLYGDFPLDPKIINGEVFSAVAMAYLIAGQFEKLEGPLGETFIKAIRLRWSAQIDDSASLEDISKHFQQYDESQLEGVSNTIKGKMFEILATDAENTDGDSWSAIMHNDESFPGSDIVLYNQDTNEKMEVSLKAVSADNAHIIESALAKYPNTPIMTTDEVAELFKGNPNIFGSGITNEQLDNITDEQLEILLSQVEPLNAHQVVIGGITMSTFAALWPFVMAYLRNKISHDQLEKVFISVMGDSGAKLASRISWAFFLGPMFAWWLLARGVGNIVDMAKTESSIKVGFTFAQNHNLIA
tara:strand:- start:471 stop:2045 length:1575 start_codon:yes stop_codon:yes gene_type:complete